MEVDYVDHMGDDLAVVNAARVSFDKESVWACCEGNCTGECHGGDYEHSVLKESDGKLIRYLASHAHFTPFTHCVVKLRETVPLFVARQRFKHMVGFTYNEVSRRYVSDEPEFFVPDVWRGAPTDGAKQGSSGIAPHQERIHAFYSHLIQECSRFYTEAVTVGVAPEQARMVLPQSMFTSYIVTGSLAAWARAYKLRSDSHAQKEIQDVAVKWDEIIRPLFPVSWEALVA